MKKAILFGVPHHSNLGDHAIAMAEKKLIKEKFPDYEYKELAEENVHKCIDKIKPFITQEDLLFFHGGGNLGNKYIFTEAGRREVIEKFPENKIILFPQTIYFENSEEGKRELEISQKIYNSHEKLYILAREEISYKKMQEVFPNCNIFLTPDIVTILQESDKENTLREGVLFIIRSDAESNVDKQFLSKLEEICKRNYSDIQYTDTAKGGWIYEHQRKQKLDEMFENYRKSELIITDRLHGMIFAAITATPCIAIGNYNHKIQASSKWFKDLPHIMYIEKNITSEMIEEKIKQFKEEGCYKYNNQFSTQIFDEVFKKIGE